MKIISRTTEFHIEERTAIAIGKFDGIHQGHKRLLHEIFQARRLGLKTVVFTFDPSPAVYFRGPQIKELMTREEKREQFCQMGIDYLVEYPFCRETAAVLPEDYVNQFLLEKMNGAFIAAGEDVSFGNKGAGDARILQEVAQAGGAQVRIIPKVCHNGRVISSTYVREAVLAGDMELAQALLQQPFFISGIVERGNQIGRTLGMPTVNIYPPEQKILPPNGVYFSTVTYGQDTFYGVTNVGCKPTVQSEKRMGVETYVFDFDEDIYDRQICVYLHHFERPEMKFDSLDALREAIAMNSAQGKAYFGLKFRENR